MSEPERPNVFREYLEALLVAAIFLGFTNTFVLKTFYIPSGSMENTLLIGDHLFVNRFIYGPQPTGLEKALAPGRDVRRGDIVIFRSPEEPQLDLVKRCVGVAGDEIQVVDKQLYVNGEPFDDDAFIQHKHATTFSRSYPVRQNRVRDQFGPFTVPDEHLFCMGDNRDESYDSRFFGPVPLEQVKGRAVLIYWSNGGETPNGDYMPAGKRIAQLFRTAIYFPTKTRWRRTFHVIR